MKYPPIAHIVNIIFLGLIVASPVIYSIKAPSLPNDVVGLILFATFILGIVIFADWYHIYFTNTYKSIFLAFATGISVSIVSIVAASFFSENKIIELLSLQNESWEGSKGFFKLFITGSGIACSAIISIPRLFLIRLFTKNELPTS